MDLARFKSIILKNEEIEDEILETVAEFNEIIDISGDSIKLIKEVGESLNIKVFGIPMKEKDFGAVSFKTKYSKYLLINTSQPSCKMNFAYYHDIYHILRQSSNILNEIREVHFNEDYLIDINECKANLFSANILMPKKKFIYMFKLYNTKTNNDFITTAYKLMNYFNAPYISVLLRIYELNLVKDLKAVENYLEYDEQQLRIKFKKLGISDEILKPTFDDDSLFLYSLIEQEGKKLIDNNIMKKNKYKQLYNNIVKMVEDIKIDEKDMYR